MVRKGGLLCSERPAGLLRKGGSFTPKYANTRVSIGDASLALFLRLVLGLYSEKSGEVPKSALSAEGYFRKDEDEYQKIGRLRDCFANIPNINRLDFITDQNKSLKLSVHPSLITLDFNRLLTHRDSDIKELTEKLSTLPNIVPHRLC